MPLAALIPAAIGAVGGASSAALLGSAALGVAGSVYGASQSNKATNKAIKAQDAATQQQLAAQERNYERISGMNQPFVQGGQSAFDQLLQEFGIGGTGGRGVSAPSQPRTYDRAGNIVPQGGGGSVFDAKNARRSDGGGNFAGTSPMASAPQYSGQGGGVGGTTGGAGDPGISFAADTFGAPGGGQPAPQGQGGFDGQSYWDANPDLAADPSLAGYDPGDLNGDGTTTDADRAQWHYQNYGQNEGRNAPQMQGQQEQPGQPAFDPTRPQASAPPEFGPRQDVAMGDFGRAPDMESYFGADKFRTDPGYGFRVSEALKGVNAASAVAGKLRSGDAAKALLERSNSLADQSYNNWFGQQMQKYTQQRGAYESDRGDARSLWQNQQGRGDTNYGNDRAYGTSLWQTGVNRGDQNFETDRGYTDQRGDTRTNNLFRLTGVGTQAAGQIAGAGTNQANAQSNIYGNQADAVGNAAYARAGANSNMVSGIGNAASNLFSAWGGASGGSGMGGQTAGQAWGGYTGGGWQTPFANPQFTNTGIGKVTF